MLDASAHARAPVSIVADGVGDESLVDDKPGNEPVTPAAAFGSVRIWLTRMPRSKGRLFGERVGARRRSAQLHVVRSGALTTRIPSAGGAVETFAPGQAFITPGEGIPMLAHRESEVLTIAIPSEQLSALPNGNSPMRIDSSLLAPTVEFVAQTMLITNGSGFSDQHLQELIPRMVDGLLIDSGSAAIPTPTTPSVYLQASAVIARRYAEPSLTADAVADAVSLSPRQLQRMFRARGTTIHGEVRRQRVKQAQRLLRDQRYDALTIDEIAKQVGFSDRSSLVRAMASEGLMSPSQIRHEAARRTAISH